MRRASILFYFWWCEAPKDGGNHLVVVLEGIVVTPRWSTVFGSIVGVVFRLFVLKFLS